MTLREKLFGLIIVMVASMTIITSIRISRENMLDIEKERTIQMKCAWKMDSVRLSTAKLTWKSDSVNTK